MQKIQSLRIANSKAKSAQSDRCEKIPKIIHYCWFGGKPLPTLAKKCIKSWKKNLPDYNIMRWDENSFDVRSHQYTKEACEAVKWAFITDYVRLRALLEFGGVYMDTDIEIIKPIDQFLKDPAFTCFEPSVGHPNQMVIQTSLLGAEKGNAWVKKLLEYYENRKFLDKFGTPILVPNTIPLTEITVREFGLKLNKEHQILKNSVVIYPKEYFCPITWSDGSIEKTNNTHAIHHFAGSWLDGKKNKRYIRARRKLGLFARKILGDYIYNVVAKNLWQRFIRKK